MINFKKWPWILAGSVAALVLWTFISVNTQMFATDDGFDYFMYYTCYILVLGIWGLITIDFKLSDNLYKTVSSCIYAVTPFFCMQIAMVLSGEPEYAFKIYFVNIMFYYAILAVFTAITRSMRWSAICTITVSFLFNIASFIVNIFRGTPLIPGDFLAIGTAAHVVENYTFEMRYPIIATTIITVFVISLIARFSFNFAFKRKNLILPVAGLSFVLVFFSVLGMIDYSESDMDVFDQYHANNTHGTLYSFYINVRKMILHKPEGYDEEQVAKMLDDGKTEEFSEDSPNIIVIMNESFSDLSVVGDFSTNIEYMPFINDMTKNTVKGELLVSPFGGYTCNTEFEFLTGLSMGLLPNGSTPYLQYASKKYITSLPSYLSENGYSTVALHPYLARCWNRQKVYGLMGFDEFISQENMNEYLSEDEWEYTRYYINDRTSYKVIMEKLKNKNPDEKLFLFNVTMQNHGGYKYEGSEFPTVTITDMNGHYQETEQYLSLIRESDKAFKEFVENLKEFDEPTIVVLFGDHQPAVEQEFYEELYGKKLDTLSTEELQNRYKVPFVIWANYDIESQPDVSTSTNYLSNLLLDTAGIPKSDFGNFTSKVMEEIPQINGMGHYDSNGEWHTNDITENDALSDYQNVEYYMMTHKE